jgi:hypothetical protein
MAILRGIEMPNTTIVVRVEIPALSAYVEFLTGRQQREIDLLAGQVAALNAKLGASGARLDDEVQTHPTT